MAQNTSEKYIFNSLQITLTSKLIKRTILSMRYTFAQFKAEYPDDRACLKAVLENRYGDTCPRCGVIGVKFHPITGRKGFVCSECDRHVYPLADTIFRKSETSLWNWFYAIYLFSTSKNGVSAKELERHLGVTYKTAWRMAKQIRLLMAQDADMLSGTVEADETYIGGYNRGKGRQFDNKKPVLGAVEKYGQAKAVVSDVASASRAKSFLQANVEPDTHLHTDESRIYRWAKQQFKHGVVNHSEGVYVQEGISTNTIEGLWSQMKRSIDGTYHVFSPKYLQSYVNEFVFRYNFRDVAICPLLLERAGKLS
jgi:transposase-like protein